MEKDKRLFNKYDLYRALEIRKQKMIDEVNKLDSNHILNTTIEELCAYFQQNYEVEVPQIMESDIYVEQKDVWQDIGIDEDTGRNIHQSGTEYIYHVPFQGDKTLFYSRPTSFTLYPPQGEAKDGLLVINFFLPHIGNIAVEKEVETLKKNFESNLTEILQYLGAIKNDVLPFNSSLRAVAQRQIETRRQKFLNDQGIVASLGFPLRRRENAPAPIVRKKLPISRLVPNNITNETFLEMEEYEHILSILKNMAPVIEKSPKAFSEMGEEDLRWHFLLQLNGHYEGQATGETFNFEGKTDILIRVDGKNIFIAECKFWKGQQGLLETIDQLLGYTSWRDTKTAILIFNRNKNFSDVLSKIPDIVKSHSNYKRKMTYNHESGSRYVFHHRDDKNRELIVTILAFEVPS